MIVKLTIFLGLFIVYVFSGNTATVCLSGCDYTNIQEAIDSIPSDLSSGGGGEWIIEVEAGSYEENIQIAEFTNASSSNYIVIKPKSGDEHNGVPYDINGGTSVQVIGITDSLLTIYNETNYTKIYDIEVASNPSERDWASYVIQSNNKKSRFERLLVWTECRSCGAINAWETSGSDTVISSVLWNTREILQLLNQGALI